VDQGAQSDLSTGTWLVTSARSCPDLPTGVAPGIAGTASGVISAGSLTSLYRREVDNGTVLVTGSSGHLGEALVRTLRAEGREVVGLDILPSPFTTVVGSITDREIAHKSLHGVATVFHTAALQKPHIGSHSKQAFIDTNTTGTLVLLEEAHLAGVDSFVFTSSTSAFGRALTAQPGAPANWITEETASIPRNIYGVTKTAAENLCELASSDLGLPIVILRTARFFPEPDDLDEIRSVYVDENVKANEFLYRRVDIEDAVAAHFLASAKAASIGFAKYIVSATTPFERSDVVELASDAPRVVRRLFPDQPTEYAHRNWRMFPVLDRIYDNSRARVELGWTPLYDFRYVLDRLKSNEEPRSTLARTVGAKGYHDKTTGVYTIR
jgi:UDP-glucose 4-epimerase